MLDRKSNDSDTFQINFYLIDCENRREESFWNSKNFTSNISQLIVEETIFINIIV